MVVEIDEKRLEALRAELTAAFMEVSKDILPKFGISGHYTIAFELKRVEEESLNSV